MVVAQVVNSWRQDKSINDERTDDYYECDGSLRTIQEIHCSVLNYNGLHGYTVLLCYSNFIIIKNLHIFILFPLISI